jgi:hypothetical protein
MPEEEEDGFDELMRLQQQFTQQQKDQEDQERQREEQGKKVQGVLQGLKDLNISMAVQQLKNVAPPELIAAVNALSQQEGTDDLRKMITALADEIETQLAKLPPDKSNDNPLVDRMRTLSILIDLYFSLHS